jgi:hypothetical protein
MSIQQVYHREDVAKGLSYAQILQMKALFTIRKSRWHASNPLPLPEKGLQP